MRSSLVLKLVTVSLLVLGAGSASATGGAKSVRIAHAQNNQPVKSAKPQHPAKPAKPGHGT